MTPFDLAAARAAFPALALEVAGRPAAFFDGPAGTQVPRPVIDAVADYWRDANANNGGAFLTSRRSDERVAAARATIAALYGAGPDDVKLGANMTSLTFHVSRSIGACLEPGDEIVVTTLDHEANVSPWHALAADRGFVVRTVDITDEGTLDIDAFDRALTSRTRLVAVGVASNALGTINPVADLVRRAHAVGAWTYLDAVAYAPHRPIDVAALGTEFLVSSAYKWYGPHLGALYIRPDVAERLPAYKVRPAHDRFETGTPNFEGIMGAAAALEFIAALGAPAAAPGGMRSRLLAGLDAIGRHEAALHDRLFAGLRAIPGVRIRGITDPARFAAEKTPTLAITVDGVHPRTVAERLGAEGIFTWDGDFYAQGLIERLGLAAGGGVVRIGIQLYTTDEEVDRLLDALERIARHPTAG